MINTSELSTEQSSDQASSGGIRSEFKGYWTMGEAREEMVFPKLKIFESGQIQGSGGDANGTFILRGQVKPDLSFTAMKLYPDHCVYLWGHGEIQEDKLNMADWNQPVPFEEIDSFSGEWGFEGEALDS